MAVFRFKLDAVLQHRRRIEDERQRELAQLLRERMILETQLRSLQDNIVSDKRTMAHALQGSVDVPRIRQQGAHVQQVVLRVQQIAGKLLGLARQVEQARSKLAEATRDRKAIELLYQRQYERWRQEQQRREAAEMDELATQAYGRRSKEMVA